MPTVLITGGTGLIGTRLTALLQERGYAVSYLTRGTDSKLPPGVKAYRWNITEGTLDEQALREADHLIHLAGAGIADSRWTDERKREIIESRTKSTSLLARTLRTIPHRIQSFVSASAIGYYGADTGTEWLSEQYTPGLDFMAQVVVAWEEAADAIAALGIRTTKMRTGIVLSTEGGALEKMLIPIRLGAGSPLGSGKQYQSWIHIDDAARLYLEAMENLTWSGAYNTVAPHPVTNEELARTAAEVLGKPFWAPNVPAWSLKLLYGEMAVVVLGGSYILNQRIRLETDFRYEFSQLRPALVDLLK